MDNRSIKPLLPVTDGMTLRQAVEESIKIWVYMARTGESSKHHHPKFDDILYMYESECPLCHHMENNEDCCLGCPLYLEVQADCSELKSPYYQWMNANGMLIRKRMAAGITRALFAYYQKEWNETYNPYEDE